MFEITFLIFIVVFLWFILKKPNKTKEKESTEEVQIIMPTNTLAPKLTESYLTLDNYIGQEKPVKYIKNHIKYSKRKNKPLDNVVLSGSGGLGKSTLIKAVANEMGGRFFEFAPANVRSIKDMYSALFTKLCYSCRFEDNPYSTKRCLKCKNDISTFFHPLTIVDEFDILFFEECHRLRPEIEETLYSLMQDGYLMLRFNGTDQVVDFPKITIAGATTRLGDLNKPFRDRFKLRAKLNPYKPEEIEKIILMYSKHKKIILENEPAKLIGKISHGVPRIAKALIDDAVTINNPVTINSLKEIMRLKGVDNNGLDETHRNIMEYIFERMCSMKNGGAGSPSIANTIGITKEEYIEVYEPDLLYEELIFMSSRGRRLTDKALNMYFKNEKEKVKT